MNILIGNEHNEHCDEDAIALFQIAVLSYHDKEIEIAIYVHCSECDKLLGKTIATVTLRKELKELLGKELETALDKIKEEKVTTPLDPLRPRV